MRGKGFTLVELLVVIAIIALLISILVPSLKGAKDITRQMLCSSNLAGVGRGLTMYTEANRGQMPPATAWSGTSFTMDYRVLQDIPGGLTFTYRAPNNVPDVDPDTGKARPYGALSVLIYHGQIDKSEMVFCPAIITGQLSRAAYPEPYGTKLNPDQSGDVAEGIIKCSYPFNPNCNSTTGRDMAYSYKNIERFPPDKIVATDPLYTVPNAWGGTWHTTLGPTSPTWVLLYADAHATTKTSPGAYALLTHSVDPWLNWPEFLRLLDPKFCDIQN